MSKSRFKRFKENSAQLEEVAFSSLVKLEEITPRKIKPPTFNDSVALSVYLKPLEVANRWSDQDETTQLMLILKGDILVIVQGNPLKPLGP